MTDKAIQAARRKLEEYYELITISDKVAAEAIDAYFEAQKSENVDDKQACDSLMNDKAIEAAIKAYCAEDNRMCYSALIKAIKAYDQAKWKEAESTKPENSRPVQTTIVCRYKRYKPQARKQGYGEGRWQLFNGYGWENANKEINQWCELPTKPKEK